MLVYPLRSVQNVVQGLTFAERKRPMELVASIWPWESATVTKPETVGVASAAERSRRQYYLDCDPWDGCSDLAQEGLDEWCIDCARLAESRTTAHGLENVARSAEVLQERESLQGVPVQNLLEICYRQSVNSSDAAKPKITCSMQFIPPSESIASASTAASLSDSQTSLIGRSTRSSFSGGISSMSTCAPDRALIRRQSFEGSFGRIVWSDSAGQSRQNAQIQIVPRIIDHDWEAEFLARSALG